mgnify:CR=1 FL=1
MEVVLTAAQKRIMEAHGEASYPHEGAGFLLGRVEDKRVVIEEVFPAPNQREAEARRNRYEISPHDFLRAEREAAGRGLEVVGVFHSHPDHPALPSAFDREHALPRFCYLITSVEGGKARTTRAWHLREDRVAFEEDTLIITSTEEEA